MESDLLEEFFSGFDRSRTLFECVYTVLGAGGPFEMQVTKSQIAFKAGKQFARAWIPGRYLKSNVPLVLSISLPGRDSSPRWKEIVEPASVRFMHHLELNSEDEIDDEVRDWIAQARVFSAG
jgi:hypothetical protein